MRPALAAALLAAALTTVRGADPPPPPFSASIGPSTDPRLASVGYGEAGVEEWRGAVDPISWAPRAFALRGFLSPQECDHLIAKATPLMEASTVVDNDSGQSMPSTVRTSTGCFFTLQEDAVIAAIERRIALVTGLPEEGGEGLQVLRYAPDGAGSGQKYDPHHDFFHDDYNTKPENGGQRIGMREGGGGGGTVFFFVAATNPITPPPSPPATVLMYLSTPEEGGETVFPRGEPKAVGAQYSECAQEGMAVKPTRGDALVFYSLTPDGKRDWNSLHGSCPVTAGGSQERGNWKGGGSGRCRPRTGPTTTPLFSFPRRQMVGHQVDPRHPVLPPRRNAPSRPGRVRRRERALRRVGRRRGVRQEQGLHARLVPGGVRHVPTAGAAGGVRWGGEGGGFGL